MSTIDLGSRRELFVDHRMLERLDGTFLKLHEPVPMETSICIDRPGEGAANAGNQVLFLDGKYLMYYRAMDNSDASDVGKSCVAVSMDGIHWDKSALQPEGTNYVLTDDGQHIAPGFLDTRPGVPRSERVKAFRSIPKSGKAHTAYNDPGGDKIMEFFASEDGLVFHRMNPQPVLETNLFNGFDGGNSMFWSEEEEQYVFYYRYSVIFPRENGNFAMRRTVARTTSRDFYTWTPPVEMAYSDEAEQFYVNNTHAYFRAPQIYIALAARFMERRAVLTREQADTLPLVEDAYFAQQHAEEKNQWIGGGHCNDCSDGVLLTSRAGSSVYDRTFMETYVRPGLGYENWVTRTNYPFSGVFPLDERTLSFYVWRCYCQTTWHVQRMALRTDGFASLSAPWKGGTALTKPFVFAGNALEINYRTSAAGSVLVEITDENGNVIPGFERGTCFPIIGDEISREVCWSAGIDPETPVPEHYCLSRLAGRPIRLRFIMKDADLFSFRFYTK